MCKCLLSPQKTELEDRGVHWYCLRFSGNKTHTTVLGAGARRMGMNRKNQVFMADSNWQVGYSVSSRNKVVGLGFFFYLRLYWILQVS